MANWKIYTPEGVQDILFEECFIKREIEDRIRKLFQSSGCLEVETPCIEFYDTFSAGTEMTPQETMFKFYDQQGRILVLRPDLTVPIARITATKYREMQAPIKYFYIGNAYKYNELGGGKQREFTQAGIEIIGVSTPEADAESIASAIGAIRAAGIENFQIDLGQVEFFKGLMEETGLSDQDVEQMRVLIDRKDFLGIEELVKSHEIREDLKELILSLPGLFGSTDVLDRAEKVTRNTRSLNALANLRAVLEILTDYELDRYVSVDLGMVTSLNYYTGIIFRGFTYGVGFPILSGGRYDTLVEKFGRNCPATGFALGINLIMTALNRQKIEKKGPVVDTLIGYEPGGRKTAFKLCGELRRQGLKVEMDISGEGLEQLEQYARKKGIGGVLQVLDTDRIQVRNLETGEVTVAYIEEILGRHGSGADDGGAQRSSGRKYEVQA